MTKRSKNFQEVQEFLTIFSPVFEPRDEMFRPFIHDGAITSLLSEEKDEEGSFHDNHSKLSISHRRGVKWRDEEESEPFIPLAGEKEQTGTKKESGSFRVSRYPGPAQVRRFEADQCIEFHKNS